MDFSRKLEQILKPKNQQIIEDSKSQETLEEQDIKATKKEPVEEGKFDEETQEL